MALVDDSGVVRVSFNVEKGMDVEGFDNGGDSFEVVKAVDVGGVDNAKDICEERVDGEGIDDAKLASDGCVLFAVRPLSDVLILFGSFVARL